MPTGDAPTTSEWSTISLPTEVWLILDVLGYVSFALTHWYYGLKTSNVIIVCRFWHQTCFSNSNLILPPSACWMPVSADIRHNVGWLIDMECKACESIKCWTHVVTFNVHLNHDLDLGFSRSNFSIAIYRNARAHRHQTKAIWVDRVLYLLCDL